MRIRTNPKKDIAKVELYHSTDVAALGLWDGQSTKEYSNSEVLNSAAIPNNSVLFNTGSDGNFKVSIYINCKISDEDFKNVYKKQLGIELVTSGILYFGSIEWLGQRQAKNASNNWVDTIELAAGKYIVNVYSTLIKADDGKPKFIQFVYELYDESKYPYKEVSPSKLTDGIDLRYSRE